MITTCNDDDYYLTDRPRVRVSPSFYRRDWKRHCKRKEERREREKMKENHPWLLKRVVIYANYSFTRNPHPLTDIMFPLTSSLRVFVSSSGCFFFLFPSLQLHSLLLIPLPLFPLLFLSTSASTYLTRSYHQLVMGLVLLLVLSLPLFSPRTSDCGNGNERSGEIREEGITRSGCEFSWKESREGQVYLMMQIT